MRLNVDKVKKLTGFTVCNVPKEHYFWALASASLTSDDANFYRFIEQLSNIYLNGEGYTVSVNNVHSFLILIHSDLSADIYLNDFPTEIEMLSKRSIEAGTVITDSDIADIRQVRFPGIDIQETDSVICCLKVGWKFGLYFNFLNPTKEFDIASMQVSLGKLYRFLSFQYVYQSLESEMQFEEMLKDGWFPFIEILGNDYKTLAGTYENEKFTYDDTVGALIDSFDESRVRKMTEKWWENCSFQEKQHLLQAGIDAFLQGTESGFINCIKTLYTEIEGVMRYAYFKDTGKGDGVKLQDLIRHLTDVGQQRVASDSQSLLFPGMFLNYLKGSVFTHFNLETGVVDVSRHSVAHGAAAEKDYTPVKALQALLALDQIYFYLS